jgi:hypothetical protein
MSRRDEFHTDNVLVYVKVVEIAIFLRLEDTNVRDLFLSLISKSIDDADDVKR